MNQRATNLAPAIPSTLAALAVLATNLRWTWDDETQRLFQALDPAIWHSTSGDPLQLLEAITAERWTELATDEAIVSAAHQAAQRLAESFRMTDAASAQYPLAMELR